MEPGARRELHAAMVRLADGDRSAFDPVFRALWPLLHGMASRMLRDPAHAEDAAQSALLRLFSTASRFDGSRDALSWVLAIAANECRAARRRRPWNAEPVADRIDPSADPEREAIRADLERALAELLPGLTEADRAALVEPGDSELSPAAARKRRQRALERLRALWRRRHGSL